MQGFRYLKTQVSERNLTIFNDNEENNNFNKFKILQ